MKIKFGAAVVDGRGKLGGHVFSKNRGGAYMRTKVTPSNPQTSFQVAQRALLASISQAWRALTEAQRLAWNSAVAGYATTNVFGDIINPTGANLHTRLNINTSLVGGSTLVLPPSPTGIATPYDVTISADASTPEMLLNFGLATVPVGTELVVEATGQMSPGIYNANNQFRVIGTLAAGTATDEDISALYIAKFGGLTVGKKLFVRVKLISKTTGEVSQSLKASTIVVA